MNEARSGPGTDDSLRYRLSKSHARARELDHRNTDRDSIFAVVMMCRCKYGHAMSFISSFCSTGRVQATCRMLLAAPGVKVGSHHQHGNDCRWHPSLDDTGKPSSKLSLPANARFLLKPRETGQHGWASCDGMISNNEIRVLP